MKVHCSLSGLHYHVDHFAGSLKAGITYHPVFEVPVSRLHLIYTDYLNSQLSPEESYLLILALLKSTDLLEFQSAAKFSENSAALAVICLTRLYRITSMIQSIKVPYLSFPKLVISEETGNLACLPAWIAVWEAAYESFISGLAQDRYYDSLKRKEAALSKFINSPQIPAHKYAHVLADWASHAANFPVYIDKYWREVIIKTYRLEEIETIPQVDLEELAEHCERHIDDYSLGTIYSHQLFTAISDGLDRIKSQKGYQKDKVTGFTLLDPTKAEHAALITVIATVTQDPPKQADFATEFEYRKAAMAFKLHKILRPAQSTNPVGDQNA